MRVHMPLPQEVTESLSKVDEMHDKLSRICTAVERLVEIEEERHGAQREARLRSIN